VSFAQQKQKLISYYDAYTMSKAKDYFRRRKVLHYTLSANGNVLGEVSGSNMEVYRSRLTLKNDGTSLISTGCSCPVGEDCKHTAALLLAFIEHQEIKENYPGGVSDKTDVGDLSDLADHSQSLFEPGSSAPAKFRGTEPLLAPEVKNSFMAIANFQRLADVRKQSAGRGKSGAGNALLYIIQANSPTFAPRIEFASVPIRKDGTFGAKKAITIENVLSRSRPAYITDQDYDIFELFQVVAARGGRYFYGASSLSRESDPVMMRLLLNRILETNRCHLNSETGLLLKSGPELDGVVAWEKGPHEQWSLTVEAQDGETNHPCLKWFAPWYIDTASGACGPVKIEMDKDVLVSIFAIPPLTTSETKNLPIILHQLGLSGMIPTPPAAGAVEKILIEPVANFTVQNLTCQADVAVDKSIVAEQGDNVRVAIVSTKYPRALREPYFDESGKLIIESYDDEVLKDVPNQLSELGFTKVSAFRFGLKDAVDQSFYVAKNMGDWATVDGDAVEGLRSKGWEISQETEKKLSPIEVDSDTMQFEAESDGNWWFSLALNIEVNGQPVPLLPLLLSAIKGLRRSSSIGDSIETLNHDGKFIAAQPDGTLISLPFDRIKSVLKLVQEFVEKGLDPDKIPLAEAVEIFDDETLSKSNWIGGKKILDLVERLRALKTLQPAVPPKDFRTELRPYQLEGLTWLQFMARQEFGGILADDMGLGKTVQLLAHICLEKEAGFLTAPYLVICPTSVQPNWISEAEKFAPQLKVVSFHGAERAARISELKDADLVISTYPLLSRDETFCSINWHGVVLDEAQAIKNHTTKLAQAARRLKAKHRFCLTGTPIENHLGELWSQYQFLLPGLLSDHATFKQHFRDPIEKLGDRTKRAQLARRIKPFIVRRTKKEVAAELPDKTIIIQHVELEGEQRDLYETVRLATTKRVRDEIAKKGFKHSRIMILDALLKLRQTCCHPQLVKLEAAKNVTKSAKLDMLIEMLIQLTEEGRKVLLFSQFTSMLFLIAVALEREGLKFVTLTGETKDRATPVKQFQNGDVPIFLISLKAGGTGLNLTASDVVIHYDPWWNPAVEEQATDRAHRIGQTKKVFVYKLIAKGTIEQRMVALQDSKRELAGSIFDESGNTGQAFTEDDLEALLRPIDEV